MGYEYNERDPRLQQLHHSIYYLNPQRTVKRETTLAVQAHTFHINVFQ